MASAHVRTLDDGNFAAEVLRSNVPVLVNFTATWCGPCKALAPIIDRIAADFAGQVTVGKVDIDESQETAKKYGVRSVPTCMVFRGGEKLGYQVGLTTRDKLVQLLGV